MSATKISFGIQFIYSHGMKIPLSFDSFIYHKRIFSMHSQNAGFECACNRKTHSLFMSMLFASKNSWIFWVTRNWFRVPKNKRKRDPNYSSNCLGTVEKWRFTLTKCTAFTTCIPYVYPIFMVCCHFLETIARAFFFFLSAYWFMLTKTEVISCGLFMLLIASSIFGYGSMLEHLKDTLV